MEITMRSIAFKRHHYRQVGVGARCTLIIPVAAIIILILAGCAAVGPDYARLKPQAPKEWHTQLQGDLTADRLNPETMANWWTTLNDQELSSLEKRAIKGNLNLKDARARVREARALRGIEKAVFFPSLDASGSASKRRSSENSGTGTESKLYQAGFDAGWELDIFGGVRRSVEAAQADLEAAQEDLHDVLVSLLAEVALNYVDTRTYQARLAAIKANMKAQQDIYELNLLRYKAGLIDELAVQQSRYILESTRSRIPTLETGLEKAKNRLAVLLGEKPGAMHRELAEAKPIPVPPVMVAVGIPAETMRHRPDIRRAERNLAARTARIGVATADLYPKFRLAGNIGLESISSSNFWEWAGRTWSIGPGVSWKIFHAGAIRQNIKVQTARQKQALVQYESAVLIALEEVENAVTAYAREQLRLESLKAAVLSARRAYELSRDLYNAGLVDFSDVLDATRSLQSYQDELAGSEGTVTSNLIRLYKALGGGWKSLEPSLIVRKNKEGDHNESKTRQPSGTYIGYGSAFGVEEAPEAMD
jgi:NodT family efflux transporter outer membrane factor (OMF) lipoprotein